MKYEWDDAKNTYNLEKHGVAFECIYKAEWHLALAMQDTRRDYGETRMLAYVPIESRLHAVIYVKRGNKRRIISLRKANPREVQSYERHT